jgi:alanine-glyoxylate transaminase / serine-glyoxylate transaminase / serine-pyruvate transaminase
MLTQRPAEAFDRAAPAYPAHSMSPRILLGPGPSMVHPRVLAALSAPLIGHLDSEFLVLMDRTQDLLRYVFETENRLTIPISGTGSSAMEAAIANTVEPGDPVLVCVNGLFGGRLAEMGRRHGGDVETISRPWGEVFDPAEISDALEQRPAKVVAIVHAETSTGALQPLDDLAAIVHAQGGLLVVDTVTSLSGAPVRVDRWDIDVCYSGTQKCLSCPPGLGPITLGPRAVDKLHARTTPVRSWYLDLTMVERYWGPDRTYHHTAPISMNFALYEALRIIAEEGLEARYARHRRNAELLWSGLEDLGLAMHVPSPEHRAPSLTTVRVPDGVDEARVRNRLLAGYGIEIAGGLGELKGRVWRIGLMGHSSSEANVLVLLAALKQAIRA